MLASFLLPVAYAWWFFGSVVVVRKCYCLTVFHVGTYDHQYREYPQGEILVARSLNSRNPSSNYIYRPKHTE